MTRGRIDKKIPVLEPFFENVLVCNDKNLRFTKTMKQAKEAMLNEAFLFLESNTLSFFRMDKDENKIIIYERNHDTLFPFLEKVIFEIKIIDVEKY